MPRKHSMYFFEFKVQGTGPFPADMLRYDRCHPVSDEDVDKILITRLDDPEGWNIPRVVTLRGYSPTRPCPTDDRWASFGWDIRLVTPM